MPEPSGPEQGHQFHFTVDIQGAHRVGDGPYVDQEQPTGPPFKATVRAWNLRDACHAVAELSLNDWLLDETEPEYQWGCRDRRGTVHSVGVETEAHARALRSMMPVRREVGPWIEVPRD